MNKIAAIMFVIGASIIAAAKMQYLSIDDHFVIVFSGMMLAFFSILIPLGNSIRWTAEEKRKEYKKGCDEFYDKHLCPGCSTFMKENNLVIKNDRT